MLFLLASQVLHLVPAGSARTVWFLDSLHLTVGTSEMIAVYALPQGKLVQELPVREVVKDLWGEGEILVAAVGWEGYPVYRWDGKSLTFLGKIPSEAFASRVVGMGSLVFVLEKGVGVRAFSLSLLPFQAREILLFDYPDVRDMFTVGQFLMIVDARMGIQVFDMLNLSQKALFTLPSSCPIHQAGASRAYVVSRAFVVTFCQDSAGYLMEVDFLSRSLKGEPLKFAFPMARKVDRVRWLKNLMVLALGREGVQILRLDPETRTLQKFRTFPTESHAYDAFLTDRWVVIVEGGNGVRLLAGQF